MSRRNSRRQFLKQSALAGAGFWLAGGVALGDDKAPDQPPATPSKESPNDKLNIACIGVGGKGSSDTDHAGNVGNIVALCDIDDRPLNKKGEKFPKAKKYNDFRKMLEEMEKQIDAVVVSTPDHTHAPASVMALRMKKHVYCQKPLTHSVFEARLMRELAAQNKLATQMGNQGTADNHLRRAVEILRDGAIGPVREVHVWTNRPIWPQAPQVMARPKDAQPVPKYVHWDLWLGPAPERPFHHGPAKNGHGTYHDFNWRGWWDFGTGALGDMGCHTFNLPYMALKLNQCFPTSVIAEAGDVNPETCPSWAVVRYEFPARGDLPPVKLTWYEGKKNGQKVLPPLELFKGHKPTSSGSLTVGDKGILYSPSDYGGSYKLLPEDRFADYKGPKESLPRNGRDDLGMKAEWIAAIKGGPPALSNFDYAGMLTEMLLLGNVAIRAGKNVDLPPEKIVKEGIESAGAARVGKKIDWDGQNLKAVNCPEADQYLRRDYRKGWEL